MAIKLRGGRLWPPMLSEAEPYLDPALAARIAAFLDGDAYAARDALELATNAIAYRVDQRVALAVSDAARGS